MAAYQLVSLKSIIQQTLSYLPRYIESEWKELALYVPGELEITLEFKEPVVLLVSTANIGAAALVLELQAVFRAGIKVQETNIDVPEKVASSPTERLGSDAPARFLLYLNVETFSGETSRRLVEEVKAARAANIPILLVHEHDTQKGGCEFDRWHSISHCFPSCPTPAPAPPTLFSTLFSVYLTPRDL